MNPNPTKTYNATRMDRARHTVSFHDGIKTHPDGSPFYDLRIFRNAKDAAKFVNQLRRDGYTERYR